MFFEWLISIDEMGFLTFFWILSLVAIFVGRGRVNLIDGTEHFPIPDITQLNAYELSALQNQRKGVIYTALFNLWNAGLIGVSGKSKNAEIRVISPNNPIPTNPFEAIIYHFIAQNLRNPKDFFNDFSLHQALDQELELVYQKLNKLHLRYNREQIETIRNITVMVFFLILSAWLVLVLVGFFYNLEGILSILSLIIIVFIWGSVFYKQNRHVSLLGTRYLKSLTNHFRLAKLVEKSRLDPALIVAILGISGLAGFTIFSIFQDAFSASESNSSDGGGGCGGGCGSCGGGGCGGCGGGGGD